MKRVKEGAIIMRINANSFLIVGLECSFLGGQNRYDVIFGCFVNKWYQICTGEQDGYRVGSNNLRQNPFINYRQQL